MTEPHHHKSPLLIDLDNQIDDLVNGSPMGQIAAGKACLLSARNMIADLERRLYAAEMAMEVLLNERG